MNMGNMVLHFLERYEEEAREKAGLDFLKHAKDGGFLPSDFHDWQEARWEDYLTDQQRKLFEEQHND